MGQITYCIYFGTDLRMHFRSTVSIQFKMFYLTQILYNNFKNSTYIYCNKIGLYAQKCLLIKFRNNYINIFFISSSTVNYKGCWILSYVYFYTMQITILYRTYLYYKLLILDTHNYYLCLL